MANSGKMRRIEDEKSRLLTVFKDVDINKLTTTMSLIDRAAFITVSLEDLEERLNEKGFVEEYQNGENQKGFKKSVEADIHISLTKNLNAIIKQLVDIVPEGQKESSKLLAMMRE